MPANDKLIDAVAKFHDEIIIFSFFTIHKENFSLFNEYYSTIRQ